ncbi:hypothetical protein BC938DRAFT_473066, partial [Jimgerdemannia flammicorona]
MDDMDWEVKIRGCQFLEALWDCDERSMDGNKRQRRGLAEDAGSNEMEDVPYQADERSAQPTWFYRMQGDQLLLEAVQDPARLVRQSILLILRRIHASLSPPLASASRKRASHAPTSAQDADLLCRIQQVDFDRLEASVSVEHLYQEAMEVDREGVDEEMMRVGEE